MSRKLDRKKIKHKIENKVSDVKIKNEVSDVNIIDEVVKQETKEDRRQQDVFESKDTEDKFYKVKSDVTNLLYFIAAIIVLIVVLSLTIYGWNVHNGFINRCSEVTSATLSGSDTKSYLVAPYHGGVVTTGCLYINRYTCEIEGKTHTARIESYHPIPNVGIIDVYYNPDNPSEYFLDKDIFDDNQLMFDEHWESRSGENENLVLSFKKVLIW